MSESPVVLKMTDFGTLSRNSQSGQNIQTPLILPPITYQGIIEDKIKERSNKALSLYKASDFEGAKREYKKLIFLSPKNPEFHMKYAEVLEKTNDVQNALVHYKRAQNMTNDKNINQKVYELMLKKGYTMLGNNHFNNIFEPIDPNTTESDFDLSSLNTSMTLKFSENDKTQAYFIRALAYLSENKNSKAIDELNNCTNNDPSNIYAFILKAKIYWNLNQVKKGYQEFWKASEINSEHPEVKEFLKLVREKTKKLYDSAIKYFWENDHGKSLYFINKGMEIEPKSVKLLLLRSLIYRKGQKYDQAMKDIEAASLALKDFPDLEEETKKSLAVTYNEMGIQMMSREDYKNAISLFDEALKFKPNDWGITTNKGDCYFKMKKFDMAKDQYNLAYLDNTKNSALTSRIGLCCFYTALEQYKLKKYYRCMQLVDEALKWDSNNTEYMCFKGKISLILNDPKTAFQSYKAATIASPYHKEAVEYLANFPLK